MSILTRVTAGLLSLLIVGAAHAGPAATKSTQSIPWRTDVRYSRTSVDDDVRNVLRSILRANGLSVLFRPGVDGQVSFHFEDAALSDAFEQVLADHGLQHTYNPDTGSVTVSPAMADIADDVGQRFVPLKAVSYQAVRQALTTFELGDDGVLFDPRDRIVSIRGDASRIDRVVHLIETLEERTIERRRGLVARLRRRRTRGVAIGTVSAGPAPEAAPSASAPRVGPPIELLSAR